MIPPYRGPRHDAVTRLVRGLAGELPTPAQLMRYRPRVSAPQALAEHFSHGPAWTCRRCGRPFPCPAWTAGPIDNEICTTLLPEFLRLAQEAVRDLRGRPGGPTPPEIVRRFLWFLPLTDDEARAIALRVR